MVTASALHQQQDPNHCAACGWPKYALLLLSLLSFPCTLLGLPSKCVMLLLLWLTNSCGLLLWLLLQEELLSASSSSGGAAAGTAAVSCKQSASCVVSGLQQLQQQACAGLQAAAAFAGALLPGHALSLGALLVQESCLWLLVCLEVRGLQARKQQWI